MNTGAFILLGLTVARVAVAAPSAKVKSISPADAVAKLRAECDVPGQPNNCLWTSYVSATERARHQMIAVLKKVPGEALPLVTAERRRASGEYREMLTIALGVLGDEQALYEAADLMLHCKTPAVRVCAAWELRALADRRVVDQMKKALADPYKRVSGECIRVGDDMIYPVRMIAAGALYDLGVPDSEVRRLIAAVSEADAQPVGPANGHPRTP